MTMISTTTIVMMTTICEIPLHECLKLKIEPQVSLMPRFFLNRLMLVSPFG
jgi:hypothetical protein